MASETCYVCHGYGEIDSGSYDNCYRCGGSGHGSHTDVNCNSCNGSGQSTTKVKNQCWNCSGLGYTTSSDPVSTSTSSTSSAKPTTKKSQSSVSDVAYGIAAIVTLIVVIVLFKEGIDIGPLVVVGIGTYLVSALVLYIAYYAVKYTFIVAFYGAIVLMIANAMEFQWAVNIVNTL